MSFWSKVESLVKEAAEAVKEGAGAASNRLAYTTKLAQLNFEMRNVERAEETEFEALGRLVLELKAAGGLKRLTDEAVAHFDRLASLEADQERLRREKAELPARFGVETIDKEVVKTLTEELEANDGTIVQVTVSEGSQVVGKKLKQVKLPPEALISTLVRDEEVVIPRGETELRCGDKLTLVGKREDVHQAVEVFNPGV